MPPTLRSVPGTLTCTNSLGRKSETGSSVSVFVPPPLSVPPPLRTSCPPRWLLNTRTLPAVAALMGCENVSATLAPRGAAMALRTGELAVSTGA